METKREALLNLHYHFTDKEATCLCHILIDMQKRIGPAIHTPPGTVESETKRACHYRANLVHSASDPGGRGYMLPEEEVQGLAECLLELDQNLHEGQTPQHQVKVEDQASTIKEKLKQ